MLSQALRRQWSRGRWRGRAGDGETPQARPLQRPRLHCRLRAWLSIPQTPSCSAARPLQMPINWAPCSWPGLGMPFGSCINGCAIAAVRAATEICIARWWQRSAPMPRPPRSIGLSRQGCSAQRSRIGCGGGAIAPVADHAAAKPVCMGGRRDLRQWWAGCFCATPAALPSCWNALTTRLIPPSLDCHEPSIRTSPRAGGWCRLRVGGRTTRQTLSRRSTSAGSLRRSPGLQAPG